jgi:hypothetical protein
MNTLPAWIFFFLQGIAQLLGAPKPQVRPPAASQAPGEGSQFSYQEPQDQSTS